MYGGGGGGGIGMIADRCSVLASVGKNDAEKR